METRKTGLYHKYHVSRVDGRDQAGGDREDARYFVLDYQHDPFARAAITTYAAACESKYPLLAKDLIEDLFDAMDLGPVVYTPGS
jgi:hypothetical protein